MNEPVDPSASGARRVGGDPEETSLEHVVGQPSAESRPFADPPSDDAVSIDDRPTTVGEPAIDRDPTLVAQPATTTEQPAIRQPSPDHDPTLVRQPVVNDVTGVEREVVEPQFVEPAVVDPYVQVPTERRIEPEPVDRMSILRVPTFSPTAPIVGLLAAWGAVVVAVAILTRANVGLGFNVGIASGGPGDDGFWAGVWLLVVNGGAFVFGGYAAARMARANGVRHAVLMWFLAMLATGADALVEILDTKVTGVVRLIPGVPFWADTNLTSRGQAISVLALFAAAALGGAILGGIFGQTANRIDRTDDAVVRR